MSKLYGKRHIPLAVTLRPMSLDDIVGQEHLLSPGAQLRKLIESDRLRSLMFFGPAGTGKTTIAEVISLTTMREFVRFNATQATIKDIRKWGEKARKQDDSIVVFSDEVHRHTRVQSDALLPFVEEGHIIFIGATTENPYHSISSALLSRTQMICELEPLRPKHLAILLKRGLRHYQSKGTSVNVTREAAEYMINVANGDGRRILSILEVAMSIGDGQIDLEIAKSASPAKHMIFGAQTHFDMASGFQGSLQASDPDAAIYWLAVWLESGEDPRYIARRIIVSASEDSCSTPEAAIVAHNAYVAACEIGRPECDIILAHAAVTIATAKRDKSAAQAIWEAVADVRKNEVIPVPPEMRDCHYPGAAELGHGAYHDGANPAAYVGVRKKYFKAAE